MNPVVQELRSKMHHTTTPSWANRAADEIERLENQLRRCAEVMQTNDPGNYAAIFGEQQEVAA